MYTDEVFGFTLSIRSSHASLNTEKSRIVRISIQIKQWEMRLFIFIILVANGLNDMANMEILWNNNNKERN